MEDRVAPGSTWMLEVTGGWGECEIKTKWEIHRGNVHSLGLWTPGGSLPRKIGEAGDTWRREKSWAVMDPDTDSL